MAKGHSTGTIFAEVDLDFEPYTKAQKKLLKDTTSTVLNVEKNFHDLGIKSAKEFDLMRLKIENAFDRIKNSSKVTADDIVRAEKAKADKIRQINEQQFGHHESMLTSLKSHYLAISAAIYASIKVIAQGWDMVNAAADFDEQAGILDNLAMKYNSTASDIVKSMVKASDGMVSNANLMQIALGGIAKGLNPEQLTNLADASRILSDTMGKSATEALQALTDALETGRTKGLVKYMGTAIDLEATFGDLYIELTDTEKAQALYNLTMISAIDLQNKQIKSVDDTADKMEQLGVKWDNLKLKMSSYFKAAAVWVSEGHIGSGLYDLLHPGEAENNTTGLGNKVRGIIPKKKSTSSYDDQIEKMKNALKTRKAAEKSEIETIDSVDKKLESFFKKIDETMPNIDKGLAKYFNGVDALENQLREKRLSDQKDFKLRYEELGKNQFDMERLQVERQSELWRQAGADKVQVAKYTQTRLSEIAKKENQERLSFYQDAAGGISNTFLQIAQAGGKYSKQAFRIYQVSAIAEATISTALAISKALGAYPPPYSFIAAAVAGAAGAVQVGAIANAQPPSFDGGGVSSAGGIYKTGDIDEAHVPIPKGKIPVEINGKNKPQNVVEIIVQGNTFADPEKEQRVIAGIVSQAVEKLAPGAVVRNYYNGGVAYQTFRGRG